MVPDATGSMPDRQIESTSVTFINKVFPMEFGVECVVVIFYSSY